MLEGAESHIVRTVSELVEMYEDISGVDPNTRVYEVYTVQKSISNEEHLLAGTCIIYPGRIRDRYFMTKGHRHMVPRAEIYIGVTGDGMLILQHEKTHECRVEIIEPDTIIYVPPLWAHRHVNTGLDPLVTLFSVAADAGHDYDYIVDNPFRVSIMATNDGPKIIPVDDV